MVEPGPSANYTQRDADDALKTAIKLAIDVRDLVRATALIEVLKNTPKSALMTSPLDAVRARRDGEKP